MKHFPIFLIGAMIALGGALAYGELRSAAGEPPATLAATRTPLRVSGHIIGLYPGKRTRMQVTVRNRGRRPLVLTSLRTAVGSASRTCTRGNIRVAPVSKRVKLPARKAKRLRVPISMSPYAATGCQNARFPLKFKATARKARKRR